MGDGRVVERGTPVQEQFLRPLPGMTFPRFPADRPETERLSGLVENARLRHDRESGVVGPR